MTSIGQYQMINAPVPRVWEVLADLGGIAQWSPAVAAAYMTTPSRYGVGASRHVVLAGRQRDRELDETILAWEEGRHYRIDTQGVRIMTSLWSSWTVRPVVASTQVMLTCEYHVRYGAVGAMLSRLRLQQQMTQSAAQILAGLKHHIETERCEPAG